MSYDTPYVFKPVADNGNLRATKTKRTEMSPDYFGVISLDLANLVNITKQDGLTIVKLSGWKKKDKSGNTYLSLAVYRYVPKEQAAKESDAKKGGASGFDDMNDDVPF